MVPAKIVAGIVAAGSVATAAVAVNQYGLPSVFKSGNSSVIRQLREILEEVKTEIEQEIKGSREKVKKWFEDNIDKKNLKIKTKEKGKEKELEKSTPIKLYENLLAPGEKTELFKSLAEEGTTFIFETTDYENWKNILTKEQITNWVKNTSNSKATLKLADENGTKELEGVKDLDKLFDGLKSKKGIFEDLKTKDEKNILFELDGEAWKHSKSEIDGWLTKTPDTKDKFEIKIKKGEGNPTALDSTDENELIGLLKHLNGNKTQLLEYKSPKENGKVALTLKKEQNNNWKLIYKDTTNDWVGALGEQKNLKLYEGDTEKPLSDMNDENELKKLFGDLTKEESLGEFKKVLESQESPKTIVFEKYGKEDSNKSWLHIKDAIKKLITDLTTGCSECKLNLGEIKIQTGENSEGKKKAEEAKDDELIGVLKHIKEKWEEYKKETTLTLKKDATSGWQKVQESS